MKWIFLSLLVHGVCSGLWSRPDRSALSPPPRIFHPIWIAPAVSQESEVRGRMREQRRKALMEEDWVRNAENADPISTPSFGRASTRGIPAAVDFDQVIQWGNQPPLYPEEALIEGWEGQVLLELDVEAESVLSASVLESSGYALLDESAQASALQWRIASGFSGRVRVPVRYELNP